MKTLIPIGIDCSVTHHLRKSGLRVRAFPFDWNVTPISSAVSLIQTRFNNFMDESNLVFLPPTNRVLFEENGIELKVVNEVITPVVDKKHKMLFPNDFSSAGEGDLALVKKKYDKRIYRLLELIDTSEEIIFLFNLGNINDWQAEQYRHSGINFPIEDSKQVEGALNQLKASIKI